MPPLQAERSYTTQLPVPARGRWRWCQAAKRPVLSQHWASDLGPLSSSPQPLSSTVLSSLAMSSVRPSRHFVISVDLPALGSECEKIFALVDCGSQQNVISHDVIVKAGLIG